MPVGQVPEGEEVASGGITPTSAPLADATANPTTTVMGSLIEAYNGATWDRVRTIAGALVAGKLTATGLLTAIVGGRYTTSRPVMADGEYSPLQVNQRGDGSVMEQYLPDYEDNANDVAHTHARAIPTSMGAWTNYASGAGALVGTAGLLIKASPGRLRSVIGVNTHASDNYFLVGVNAAALAGLAGAATTLFAVPLAGVNSFPGSGNGLDFGSEGMYFGTGIVLAISTLPNIMWPPATNDCAVFARYI